MLIISHPALVALHEDQRSADTDFRARIVFGALATFTLVGFVVTNNIFIRRVSFCNGLKYLGFCIGFGKIQVLSIAVPRCSLGLHVHLCGTLFGSGLGGDPCVSHEPVALKRERDYCSCSALGPR